MIYGAILSSFSGSSTDFVKPTKDNIRTANPGIKKVVKNIRRKRTIAPDSDQLAKPKAKGSVNNKKI
jgi:hypothetical protein